MRVATVAVAASEGHILLHNIVNPEGRKVLAKGTRLALKDIETLHHIGYDNVNVAVLEESDVHEDTAATTLATVIMEASGAERMTRAVGGRVNFHSDDAVVLYLSQQVLVAFNMLPGITVATRPPHSVMGRNHATTEIATLKIIPYAIPQAVVDEAVVLAERLFTVGRIRPQRVALLITADEGSQSRIRQQFEAPTRTRLAHYQSTMGNIMCVPPDECAIARATADLLTTHDALFIGGQTSVMDAEDTTLRALRGAGVEVAFHGTPVEPGNLMALGYYGSQWVVCAPGCAKSLERNVVDLVLPRLLAGEQIDRRAIAELGIGGLL